MKDLFNKLLSIIYAVASAPYKFLLSFCSKDKKSNTRQDNHHSDITAPKIISSNTPQVAQPQKEIVSVLSFPTSDGDYILHREYKDGIALPQNLDKVKLNDSDIQLVPEPDNQYDPYAVALYKGEHKLGYFYKGTIPYMVLNYLNREDYRIKTIVCSLDNENNKLAVKIAFYRKSDLLK